MTTKTHSAITSQSDLHECKGIGTATAGQFRVADGAGGANMRNASQCDIAYSLGNISGAVSVSLANGSVQYGTLTGNITSLTITGEAASPAGNSLTLYLTQDGTGSRTLTTGAGYRTAGGAGLTLSTANGSVDILVFITKDQGTTWDAGFFGKAFA